MISRLPRFPCSNDKTPLIRWTNGARADVDDTEWALVGVPTGSVTGLDCLDVDVEGLAWLESIKERLPLTRMHVTRSGGRHLLFNHAQGLRCSAGRIAKAVDVRADGGYIIWWCRQGLPFDDRPIANWPEWLLRLAQKSSAPWVSDGGIRNGVPLGNSTGSDDGIDGTRGLYHGADDWSRQVKPQPTRNFRARSKSILRQVEFAKPGERNRLLNWGAYQFGQMVAEGKINPDIAALLLEGAAKVCGLWHDDGPAQCKATIKSGIAAGIRDAREMRSHEPSR
jgi:bifunctional DNA primase/polymerase-like protein